jgi:hypothetical protein
MNMSGHTKVWISVAAVLVCAQAVGSLFLRESFALAALTDITQFTLLLAGSVALLLNALRPAVESGCSGH